MESKFYKYIKRQNDFNSAITLLDNQGLYLSAAQVMWTSIKNSIFHYLEESQIDFNSTQEAVLLFILSQDSAELKCSLYNFYTSSIIIDWDTDLNLAKKDYDNFKEKFLEIHKSF